MPTGVYKRIEGKKYGMSGKTGYVSWNKGKKCSILGGKNQHLWKGDKASYWAIHIWLKNNFGKPNKCENKDCKYPKINCRGVYYKKPKRYEWANISGNYTRNKKDYKQLCPSCHRRFDRGLILKSALNE